MQKSLLAFVLLLFAAPLSAQQPTDPDSPQSYPPMLSQGRLLGHIPALRDLEPLVSPVYPPTGKLLRKRNYFFPNALNNPSPQPQGGDPLAPKLPQEADSDPEITPLLNFEGLRDPSGVTPPDPSGDVGKDHYMQMINSYGNSWFQIWNKQTGQSVYGPALSSTIWQQVEGVSSIGDPIIQYDADAQRWLMMEMQDFAANGLLLAISDGPDPTGGWKAYAFQTLGFPDYPKLYVWNNAYFITANELVNGNVCSGFALEREAILSGAPNFKIYRYTMPNYLAIQYQPATGADWEAGPPPPPGSPGYIFRLYDDAWDGGSDHIQIWSVFVDWNDVAQSHIDGPQKVFPAPFETRVCWSGLFDCIEQPGNAPRITALENIIMYRAPYRNFGDHESVVFNHVADVSGQTGNGGDAAVRWYELRKSGTDPWAIYQQGTYAPDLETNRFMGTISIDEGGNIGLGYSACSEQTYPGLRVTGRRAGDPPGTMPVKEYMLAPGAKSHQDERWGDYSSMAVDPEDGRTFWFTGEYQAAGAPWGTRIGSFRIQRDTYDVTPTLLKTPVASALLGNAEAVTVEILDGGLEPASNFSVSLYFENNLVVTDNIAGPLASGATLEHTFSQTVSMPEAGKQYAFRVVTHWVKDAFTRNDTLNAVVKKLTANDASAIARTNFPGIICGTFASVGLVIRNASGLPMTSAQLRWKINQQVEQTYQWTGNLAPGARDTIPITVTGVQNGQNSFRAYTALPNGLSDQNTANDTLLFKFYGNLDGTYLTASVQTDYGILKWELQAQDGTPLVNGEIAPGSSDFTLCTDDNVCYQLVLRSQTLAWQGKFRLFDIFGHVLFEAGNATFEPVTTSLCTPVRYTVDVGAYQLIAPVSSPGLSVAEPVKISVRNFGLQAKNGIQVAYRLNNGVWHTETLPGILVAGAVKQFAFNMTEDLSLQGGQYDFELRATVAGDEDISNDTIHRRVLNRFFNDLAVESLQTIQLCTDGSTTLAQASILLRNNGLATAYNFEMQYSINGVVQTPQPGFIEIPTDGMSNFYFSLQGTVPGVNNLAIDIGQVNGQNNDDSPGNDVAGTSFDISPNGVQYILNTFTDSHPEQTSWQLTNEQGQVLRTFGPFDTPFLGYVEYLCLPLDSCYHLRLLDSGGDGMQGSASLITPQQSVWTLTDNNFGSLVEVPFCVSYDCADLQLNSSAAPDALSTPSADGSIQAQATGGAAPYQYALDNGQFQADSLFIGLTTGVYTLRVLDANGCATQQQVFVDQTTAAHEPAVRSRELLASPNPTKGLVNLLLPARGQEQTAVCEVYDSRGKLLQTARLVRWDNDLRGVVALDTYPPGLYVLQLRGLSEIFSARVVKN